jgi:hypothetical protein
MSSCIASRLKFSIAAGQTLIQQLSRSPSREHLDTLYVSVFCDYSHGGEERAGPLLCAIALLKKPATPTLLAAILGLPLKDIRVLLQMLINERLVTPVSPLDNLAEVETFCVCHQSLFDFFIDPSRYTVKHSRVDSEKHRDILSRCLWFLNTHLTENICAIRNPGLANVDVPDLSTRITRSVPEAVRYASLAWPLHLVGCSSLSGRLSAALLHFCREHLLHWLEVLSLLGELSFAFRHFPAVIEWCQVSILSAM